MALEVIKVTGSYDKQTGKEPVEFLLPKEGIASLKEISKNRYSVKIKAEYMTGVTRIVDTEATISNVEIL